MKRPDVIAFLHLLLDMFGPLRALSLTLQSDHTTLADVGEKLKSLKMQSSPSKKGTLQKCIKLVYSVLVMSPRLL